ncbi:MAG: primosomal protein N' [Phycisphaerae bacterium]|nr:primosomal protein N' [Phycisphaerae bacterium]
MTPAPDAQARLWTESPEVRIGPVARVAMLAAVDKLYSFSVPDTLAAQIMPGKRLTVPFGRKARPATAFCVSVAPEPWTSTLKPVIEVLDDQRLLSDRLLELGQWISRYYACPLGRTLSAMVPASIRDQSGFHTVRGYRPLHDDASSPPHKALRSTRRQEVIKALASQEEPMDEETLCTRANVTRGILTAMVKAGLLAVETRREPAPAPNFDRPGAEPDFQLNTPQKEAIQRVSALAGTRQFKTVLLYGVSGSGKTEVYIHSIRSVLAAGRQAILLVPEIALTTHLVDRLVSRFRDVAVIHSGLTGVQRSLTWSAIARGLKRVIIGTRSAVFAPCPDLGLIILDEEQEGSYKNQQSPRFHTRDVAIKRAQMTSIPVVLGSATPSLETWYNCDRFAHFERIFLPARISGLPMPAVELADMRLAQRERKGIHLLSPRMESLLAETLDAGQQAVLLLNRRGYANYLVCTRCRRPIVCPQCRVNMVFHQTTEKAVCHYCNTRIVVPRRCGDASCGGTLVRFGMGTQRVEEELHRKFPTARIARADSDTMTHFEEYKRVLKAFAEHQLDILLGTQMIAKGLDFPSVAFVGVVNADTSLAIPDFRAAERTFQLVTQVAGRAGRAEAGGRVIVQTFMTGTPALQFATTHDYPAFARHELGIRQALGWPPFTRLARLVVSDPSQSQAAQLAMEAAETLRQFLVNLQMAAEVLGPQSAPLSRLKNRYRYDLLIRAANANRLMEVVDRLRKEGVIKISTRHVLIDVDPVSLL